MQELVGSIRRKVEAVIKAKGSHTKYSIGSTKLRVGRLLLHHTIYYTRKSRLQIRVFRYSKVVGKRRDFWCEIRDSPRADFLNAAL